ncbi:MAG TPA: lytic transglycosylase domain-containing protein [Syntrophales bacterium]|nr:lytic transglycosylase domain-containing protein [Syntrophales bacterium]
MKRLWIVVLSFFAAIISAPGWADIYRYVDENGVIHFTNVPTRSDVRYTLIYREKRVQFKVASQDMAKYDHIIRQAARKYDIDPQLIKAIIKAESNFDHRALSPKGAQGLMQLMPQTASYLQVENPFHPEHNIEGGTRYLKYLLRLFQGNLPLALAAYNAGENAVMRYGGIPPFRETRQYVQQVLNLFQTYRNREGN